MDQRRTSDVYKWINKIYISRSLNVDLMDVINYKIKPAIGKGNNYASTLLRIEVELKNNTNKKFLIKCLPEGSMKTIVLDAGLWDKEIHIYTKVLPVIEKLVNYKLGPKFLNSDIINDVSRNNFHNYYNSNNDFIDFTDNNKVIVVEDLSNEYKMANRRDQLDYDHCVIVMKIIAKFHAGSVAAKKLYKNDIYYAGEELLFRETRRETNEPYLKQPFLYLSNELIKNNKLQRYGKHLINFSEKLWDFGAYAAKPKEFNVLNHGDLWTNNILFKYNRTTGDVEDGKLIDFQCCRYASPAFDLQHFFMTSLKEDVRETKLKELVNIYINCLNKELTDLNEKPLSEEQLDKDLTITDCYGLYTAVSTLPVTIRDEDGVADNEDICDYNLENNPFIKCIKGKKYQKLLPNLLKYFEKKGLFEDNYDVTENFYLENIENNNIVI